MEIILLIIIGFLAGLVARALVPGNDSFGILGTIILGIAGSFVGGFLARALFGDTDGVGFIGATIGAILLLIAYRAATSGRTGL